MIPSTVYVSPECDVVEVERLREQGYRVIVKEAKCEVLLEALEFYAERTQQAFRGTTGRWTDYDRWPQPREAIGGDPSMWDNGQIARHALAKFAARPAA